MPCSSTLGSSSPPPLVTKNMSSLNLGSWPVPNKVELLTM
ncbi:Uncharacterised protein [Bordetella pertussis]|nr:Uncharacterised protein [Bordetella pertussis]